MLEIKLKNGQISRNDFSIIISHLKNDRVLILPTDTIYGLSCRGTSIKGIKKIKQLKKRGDDKPFIILVDGLKMAKKYVFLSDNQEKKLKEIWFKNRPTTIILKHRHLLPRILTGKFDSLALRLPKSKILIKIIKELGEPIISTSLNLSGQKNLSDPSEFDKYFFLKNKAKLIVNSGKCRRKKASRLVDLSEEGKITILRK